MSKTTAAAFLAFTLLTSAACTDTQFPEATGDGLVRGINGIVNADDTIFSIEEQELAQLGYKDVSNIQEYDNLTYTFNFDLPIIDAPDRRIAQRFLDLVEDIEYTFVLAGTVDNAQVVLWERPEPQWDGTETTFDVGAGHVSTTAGAVDVYLTAPRTLPVLGEALGTLAFGEQLADTQRTEGDFQLYLTAPGNPDDVLFRSATFPISGADTYTIAIFDAEQTVTGNVSVRFINSAGAAAELADERFPPTTQFVHAAFGTGDVDIVAAGDFANPLVSGLGVGQVSADVPISPVTTTYTFAPTGNTMALLDRDLGAAPGTRTMLVLLGPVGDLRAAAALSERRGLSTVGQLRVTHASNNSGALDVYLTEPGSGIADGLPSIIGLPFGQISGIVRQLPNTYDLTVTLNEEETPLAGPLTVTLDSDDFLEVVILDTADPNVVDFLTFSNVTP